MRKWTKERFSKALRTDCRCFRPTLTSFYVDMPFKDILLMNRSISCYFTCYSCTLKQKICDISTLHLLQVCSINMTVGRLDKPTTLLFPKDLLMEQDPDMTLFQLNNWSLRFRNETDPKDGIWMTVVLKRKILSEMMITFLPSLLLLMITFATTFFKPFF